MSSDNSNPILRRLGVAGVGGKGHLMNLRKRAAPTSTPAKPRSKAWLHVKQLGGSYYQCLQCGRVFRTVSVSRIEEHILGNSGNIAACPKPLARVYQG